MSTTQGMLHYGAETIPYFVRYLDSRSTLTIEVWPDGRVVVRAPANCAATVIEERMRKRAGWISRQLREFERFRPRTPERQYVAGESHLYLGRQYRLKLVEGTTFGVNLLRGQMMVTMPSGAASASVRTIVQRWYFARARTVFSEVLASRIERMGIESVPRLAVRSMQSRWGSLSPKGTMTLNTTLVRAPRACIEYVVTHELCHIHHRHHDARFYRLLGKLMPDWEKRKEQLEAALL